MKKRYIWMMAFILPFFMPITVYAMHIAEGYLPAQWCLFYFIIAAPFFIHGIKDIRKKTLKRKDIKMLFALIAAYCFVLSSIKIPSVAGSSSHPTGTGLGAVIFGPFAMAVIGTIVLIFQAIFLAHGGITTLGANTFSMGIVGPIVSFIIYKILKEKNMKAAIFLAAALGDLSTYIITSLELALAFPAKSGGIFTAFIKFCSIFAITQIPLAIIEGIMTVFIFEFIEKYSSEELDALGEVE